MEAVVEDELVRAGRFTVLSRSHMDRVMRELNLSQSALIDPNTALRIGKHAAAQYIVVVSQISFAMSKDLLGRLSTNVSVQFQAIETEKGTLIASDTKDFNMRNFVFNPTGEDPDAVRRYREALTTHAREFTTKMAAGVPLDSQVVYASNGRYAILGGAELGMTVGTEFVVQNDGKVIEVAGVVVGDDRYTIGRVRIVSVDPKIAWVEILKTYSAANTEDPSVVPSRITVGLNVRMVQTETGRGGR
jgi:hypothetical protein